MSYLTRTDLQKALRFLNDVSSQGCSTHEMARAGVAALPGLVGSEITTLSVCDLASGKRSVVSNPSGSISLEDLASFDRHFHQHPLVRYHASHPGGASRRISDLVSANAFHRTAVYGEYYHRIGIDSAIAVPLFVDRTLLVSFVLNRAKSDFSERERSLLDLLRGPLAALYRTALVSQRAQASLAFHTGTPGRLPRLTPREREVMQWVTAGKTNQQIAEVLRASPRTVQKHLEHVFDKLGVDTRTAAVMRWRGTGDMSPTAGCTVVSVPTR